MIRSFVGRIEGLTLKRPSNKMRNARGKCLLSNAATKEDVVRKLRLVNHARGEKPDPLPWISQNLLLQLVHLVCFVPGAPLTFRGVTVWQSEENHLVKDHPQRPHVRL